MSFKTEAEAFLAANPTPDAVQLNLFVIDCLTEDASSRVQLDKLAEAMKLDVDLVGESVVDKATRLMGKHGTD